ncbi:MAG: AtpZ/AtpI family protein [Magnetococcales bacterium]|nr:AtpZ/AtpI family protein [Magnetococcales bacterium]NGZ27105.1 AtpZ/AtpI family protein [Magnetococcales bacterium]
MRRSGGNVSDNQLPSSGKSEDENLHQGSSKAITMATEMVAATLIGFGIGYGLDQWLGSDPWCKAIFFLFGVIAGFLNVFRAANPEMFARPSTAPLDKEPPQTR